MIWTKVKAEMGDGQVEYIGQQSKTSSSPETKNIDSRMIERHLPDGLSCLQLASAWYLGMDHLQSSFKPRRYSEEQASPCSLTFGGTLLTRPHEVRHPCQDQWIAIVSSNDLFSRLCFWGGFHFRLQGPCRMCFNSFQSDEVGLSACRESWSCGCVVRGTGAREVDTSAGVQ